MNAKRIAIGIIGTGWMGSVHCRAYREVSERFPDSGLTAELVACADSLPGRAAEQAQRLGIKRSTEDWRELLADPEIDAVSIATRNDSHYEIAIAALEAGKHVFCEKPVGRTPDETAAIAAAAATAGVVTFVGFCYRWVPVVQYCADLVASGELGEILHFIGRFSAPYGASPNGLRTWRFDYAQSGYGALGDLMTHIVDLSMMLCGPITEVTSQSRTVYHQRPAPWPGADHYMQGSSDDPQLPVTNDDAVVSQATFQSGATAVLEASRINNVATNDFGFEIFGSRGTAAWQFRRQNELSLFLDSGDPKKAGIIDIHGSRHHANHARFASDSGAGLNYDALQVIGAHHFLSAIARGHSSPPDFASTARVAQVTAAMAKSWDSRRWESVA